MKRLITVIALVFTTCALNAATGKLATDWNDTYGMGNRKGDSTFTGYGVPMAVIGSVRSNTLYYVTSADSPGQAHLDDIYVATDFLAATIKYYIATNYWEIASNGVAIGSAATNVIWLTATNAGMATNDVLIFEDVGSDSYQAVILGGSTVSATGLYVTNSLGECGIYVWNGATNLWGAGDRIWRTTEVASYTPLGMAQQTNEVGSGAVISTLMRLGGSENPIKFRAPAARPSVIALTYSNAATLQVNGEYYVRPARR